MNSTMHQKLFTFLMITATTSILLPSATASTPAAPTTPATYGFKPEELKDSKTKGGIVVTFTAAERVIKKLQQDLAREQEKTRTADEQYQKLQEDFQACQRDKAALDATIIGLKKHQQAMATLAAQQREIDGRIAALRAQINQ